MGSQGHGVFVSGAQRTGCTVRNTHGGPHKGHPIHQAVLGNVTCVGGGTQAPSGSGVLFSGACTRPDNATFANSLTTATLGRAAGWAGWGQEAGDERKMQNLHSGDGAICTLGPVCVSPTNMGLLLIRNFWQTTVHTREDWRSPDTG